VGRTTHAIIVLLVILGVVAIRIQPELLGWLAGGAIIAFVVYFLGVIWYGHNHRGASLLEGSELLHWQQAEIAAKSTGVISSLPVLPDPTQPELPPAPGDTQGDAEETA
jgi:Na+/proline symporter